MKLIKRPEYMSRLFSLRGSPDIKVLTGIRRSGKSLLLKENIADILALSPPSNIVSIDFNDLVYESLKEYHRLNEYALSKYKPNCSNYLVVDEIQECPEFEKAINSLHSTGKFDIYLTGSNAFLLGGELATLFTGRYMEIKVLPFSFKEYLAYFGGENDLEAAFDSYCLDGGMPGYYAYMTKEERTMYVRGVYQTIIEKDIKKRYSIKDDALLRKISDFLLDNIGNLSTAKKISDALTSAQHKTNHVTVDNYLGYLANAFLFYKTNRYDIRGKQYLQTLDKYYLSDICFRSAILGNRDADYGRIYENLVFLELRRRGYEVYIGKLYDNEIDFVARRSGETLYIQVSDDIADEKTRTRELGPLLKIRGGDRKMILARTRHETTSIDGIEIVDLARWLAGCEQSEKLADRTSNI